MITVEPASDSLLEKFRQGNLTGEALFALLNQYGMMPQFQRELLIDDAIASITLDPEAMHLASKQFYQQHKIDSDATLKTWMQRQGLDQAQLNHLITRSAKLNIFKQATWGHKLESYFLQRKPQLDQVVYSLLRVKEPGIAQELFFRIQNGEQPFAEIARAYSQGPEAETGGIIGPMELSTPHPTLAKMLAVSQPGQLLPPTRLNEWIVIVRLEQLVAAQFDAAMQQRLLTELFERWVKEQLMEN
jgi:parvulin-like peptidyl-prolyl isomerase